MKLEPLETITGRTLNEREEAMYGVVVALPREVEVTIDQSGMYGRGAEQVHTGRDVILADCVARDMTGWAMWRGTLLDPNNQPIHERAAQFEVHPDDTIEVWS